MNVLHPIKMPTVKERAAAELRKAILSHQFQEGDVLTLDSVAAQLNISTTSVREAFQILARDGLIRLRTNKGAIVLNVTGVLDASSIFAGYVNSNVILCVGMFVVGETLFQTGMANKIGSLVTRFAKSERQLIVAIMVIVGVMSGFLSNTGTAAVLIPVVCGIADESGYSRSRLRMPLAMAAALGGGTLRCRDKYARLLLRFPP